MEANPNNVDEMEEASGQSDGSGNSGGFENIKNKIAEKLHYIAEVMHKKADDPDTQADIANCEKHASEWLERSAECIKKFDYKKADAKSREYIRQNPGRSIMIASAIGLIIGAAIRGRKG